MTANVEHSLTYYDNVFSYIVDISLRTTLKLRANGRKNGKVEQCCELLGNTLTFVCRGLSDTFMVKNIGFLSCTVKVRAKTAMSTSKRDEQPRHFHMGVPLPTKEQDRDDKRNCLMGCYNKFSNSLIIHKENTKKINV